MTTVAGIDVSSHQPRDLSAIIAATAAEHVVTKMYLPMESISQDHTRAQVASAQAHGCSVGGYVWGYRSVDPGETIDAVIALCASMGLVLPLLWLDCEVYLDDPGPERGWLRAAKARADFYGMKLGIYTGVWWIDGHFPGGQAAFAEFADWPLWLADYRNWGDIGNVPRPLGFDHLEGWQWSGASIDRDWFDESVTVYQSAPPPDPCAELRAAVQAIADRRPYRAPSRKVLREVLGK